MCMHVYIGSDDLEQTMTMDDDGEDDECNKWFGFRIVGDNLDKNVKPRNHRIDHGTTSLHFFNLVALRDRIDLSDVSDDPSTYLRTPVDNLELNILLPSNLDYEELISSYEVLMSRVLVAKVPYFARTFDDVVVKHISHEYSREMSKKTEAVCCVIDVIV